MSGYEKIHSVSISARADTLETIAGFDDDRLSREIGAAMKLGDEGRESLQWLALLIAESLERMTARG